MIRFTLTTDGVAMAPRARHQDGRGLYLCPDASCLKAARKKRRLEASVDLDPFEEWPEIKTTAGGKD